MSVDLTYQYYPKECDDDKILPFLATETDGRDHWINGRHVPRGFYAECERYSQWDDAHDCWIFRDVKNLFEFAAKPDVPDCMSDYITNAERLDWCGKVLHKPDDIFIIWKR